MMMKTYKAPVTTTDGALLANKCPTFTSKQAVQQQPNKSFASKISIMSATMTCSITSYHFNLNSADRRDSQTTSHDSGQAFLKLRKRR